MRFIYLFITSAITIFLCVTLNTHLILPAPLGKLLSPQEGIWQNAEATDMDYSADLHFNALQGQAEVYFDKRLVPHVFAEKETDAYFIQGYLHARFRLWQMELQTLYAAGRISEWVGDIAVDHDREFRRLGMVYAAEQSLKEMEADPLTKSACDAYTAGVNAYIGTLNQSNLPLEYKLLGVQPEKWNNLKSALFLKYMTFDLCGHDNDFGMTNAMNFFNKKDFDLLFPAVQDSLDPIIPKGTVYATPQVHPHAPAMLDSLYYHFKKDSVTVTEVEKPNPENGSNNWAVAGSKTKSGAPILCNDPHLGLNLPSVWYEMQISTPEHNTYGVSFPGAPGIIIGYNDYCAFGFTNGGRDVRDYYEINFKDPSRDAYWFDSAWVKTERRIEHIKIKDKPEILDTVAYTIFGPVMYDGSFAGKTHMNPGKNYAVKWAGHQNSNEFKLFYLLDRAKNYNDYLEASHYLFSPGQNIVFASKNGDIALRTQGRFPAKWEGQGDFIMPGTDSSYLWQDFIPENETPFQYNPERGFVSSANQRPTDTAYHYYLGREYPMPRGIIINRKLNALQDITVRDMMDLQNNNYNVLAEMSVPIILKNIDPIDLNPTARQYLNELSQWKYTYSANDIRPTIYELTWKALYDTVYQDEYQHAPVNTLQPYTSTLIEALLKDSSYHFVDDITTGEVETLPVMMTKAFKKAVATAEKLKSENKLSWGVYQDAHIDHLLKIPSLSTQHLQVNGGANTPNANTSNHGPSWRMIVHLLSETEAYGIYPGGQNGNPGSRFYDDGIAKWTEGKYYPLWMMRIEQSKDQRVKWKMRFSRS